MPLRRVFVVAALAIAIFVPATFAASIPTERQVYGHSVRDRDLVVYKRGFDSATVNVLVVGMIHGNEQAGSAIIRQLRSRPVPRGVRFWLVTSANPDGQAADTRHNARGVDLNRNFPANWRASGRPWDTYYPGRAAASEPETRAIQALVRRVHPDVTIWYHQHANQIVKPDDGFALRVARRYATISGLPLKPWGTALRGTAVSWQSAFDPESAPFVVELPAGDVRSAAMARHVRAVDAAGRMAVARGD